MVDGSITISTKIDQSGFRAGRNGLESGIKNLMGSLKSLAATVGVAFGVAAVVNFGKASVTAATDLTNALIGLQSIVNGQGRNFSKAKSFLNDYVSDGLIPLTDAVTAYKNLAMRGYDDSQIQSVMTALKNSASFGRQASLTMGQAVNSATEGLKNENSILVDNAGVTKNVSVMWKDYANSIGVGVDSLTQAQKVQAEVNGILKETRFQINDAAKVANTYSGQVSKLKYNFNLLKVAIGNAITPILQAVIPVISAAISKLTFLANTLSSVMSQLFGLQVAQQQNLSNTANTAADSINAVADATESASKATKKATANFDTLNVLNNSNSSSNNSYAGNTTGSILNTIVQESTSTASMLSDKILAIFKPLQNMSLDNLSASFDRLKRSLEPLSKTFFDGIEWAYYNIFVPLAKFTIEETLPRFLDFLATSSELLGKVFEEYMQFYKQFFSEFLKPIADFAAPKFLGFLDNFNEKFKDFVDRIKKSEMFSDLRSILSKIYPILVKIINRLIDIGLWFANFVVSSSFLSLRKRFADLEDKIGLVADLLNGDFAGAWEHFKDLMVDNKIDDAKEKLDLLKNKFGELKTIITGWIDDWKANVDNFVNVWKEKISAWWDNNVVPWFTAEKWKSILFNIGAAMGAAVSNFVDFWNTDVPSWWDNDVRPWFTLSKWQDLLNSIWISVRTSVSNLKSEWGAGISSWWNNDVSPWFTVEKWKEFGTNMKDGIIHGFKSVANGVVDILNAIISGFEDLVNEAASGINDLISGFNSASPLVKLNPINQNHKFSRINHPFPELATGTVIPPNSEFLAVLGDQKHGMNIEAPLDTIVNGMMIALDKAGYAGNNARPIEVILELDGIRAARAMIPPLDKERNRMSVRPVTT